MHPINNIVGFGEITEISSIPGCGKTNVCMTLCINAMWNQSDQMNEVIYIGKTARNCDFIDKIS